MNSSLGLLAIVNETESVTTTNVNPEHDFAVFDRMQNLMLLVLL